MRGDTEQVTSADRTLEALSHPDRRRVLFTLLERDERDGELQIPQETLVGLGDVDAQLRLHHAHLPKLAEYEYIQWNDDVGTISRGANWSDIEPLLETLYRHVHEHPPKSRRT